MSDKEKEKQLKEEELEKVSGGKKFKSATAQIKVAEILKSSDESDQQDEVGRAFH